MMMKLKVSNGSIQLKNVKEHRLNELKKLLNRINEEIESEPRIWE